MINFKSLTMRNFLSYGNNDTTVMFDKSGSTLIMGENGVGKSTIINALSFCLYGKPISNDISLDNLINNINKKDMCVSVVFEINNVYYKVVRARKSKQGAWVKLYRNKKEAVFTKENDISPDSASRTTELIEKKLGMIHELFVRIVVFSANHIPFLQLPVRHTQQANQTKIIEELFSITRLSSKAKMLKTVHIKDNELLLKSKKALLEQLEKEHERHNSQVLNAETRVVDWDKQHDRILSDLQSNIEVDSKINIEEQKKLHTQLKDVSEGVADLERELKSSNNELATLANTITKKQKELKELSDSKCPRCHQPYKEALTEAKKHEEFIEEYGDKLEDLNEECISLQQEVNKIHQQQSIIREKILVDDYEVLLEMNNKLKTNKERLKEKENEENPFLIQVEELKNADLDEINYDELDDLTDTIEHQKFLYKLLTNKDSFVRKALLDKNIPFLNMKLQEYLSELDLPYIVQFNHNLTATIMQFGRQLDFGNLSNGQKSRVNLGLSLAFRDVLQNLHQKINICLFDEVLDYGLSSSGIQKAARLLKRKARDEDVVFFIITHEESLQSTFDRTMHIELKNGFSVIS